VITIHLHLPGSQDEAEYAVYALSDGEALSLPSRYFAPDAHETIHIANEIAFDAFRLAITQEKISHTNIRWRMHDANGIQKGVFSEYGVPLTRDGKQHAQYHSPGNRVVEEILMTTSQRLRAIKLNKIRELEAQRPKISEPDDNCKGKEHEDETPPSVG
jgi:hypothetical protein